MPRASDKTRGKGWRSERVRFSAGHRSSSVSQTSFQFDPAFFSVSLSDAENFARAVKGAAPFGIFSPGPLVALP